MSDTGSQATVRFDVASTGLSRLAPARMAGNLGVVFVPAGEGRRFGQAVWIAQEERRSARNGARKRHDARFEFLEKYTARANFPILEEIYQFEIGIIGATSTRAHCRRDFDSRPEVSANSAHRVPTLPSFRDPADSAEAIG